MAGIASPVLKLSEKFMAREITGPSGEATAVNLLTEHDVPSSCLSRLCLCPDYCCFISEP